MTGQEVELINIRVSAAGKIAISMKIYRNGIIARYGAGGLPELGISGMSFFNHSSVFDRLLPQVPEKILTTPQNYEEETPNGSLEYVVALYGVSQNGEHGEGADWGKSTGARVCIDQQSSFRHPIVGFLDNFTLNAAELTNEWYFDIMMEARYGMRSSTLPETIFTRPNTESEINDDFENYINQMLASARHWDMTDFCKNKTYEKDGRQHKGIVTQKKQSFRVKFTDSEKKPVWKFW